MSVVDLGADIITIIGLDRKSRDTRRILSKVSKQKIDINNLLRSNIILPKVIESCNLQK